MKIVKELPEIFDEFGEQRRKAFLEIKQYKEKVCRSWECTVHIFHLSLQLQLEQYR